MQKIGLDFLLFNILFFKYNSSFDFKFCFKIPIRKFKIAIKYTHSKYLTQNEFWYPILWANTFIHLWPRILL